jgi:DNA-directed RNA polymerase alpha subunit
MSSDDIEDLNVYKVTWAAWEEGEYGRFRSIKALGRDPEEAIRAVGQLESNEHIMLVKYVEEFALRHCWPGTLTWRQPPEARNKALVECDGVTVRLLNTLVARMGIRTLGSLAEHSEVDLLMQRSFGRKSVDRAKKILAEHGMELSKIRKRDRGKPETAEGGA